MNFFREKFSGFGLCFIIALASWYLGNLGKLTVIGSPVFAILIGMTVALFIKNRQKFLPGIQFTSKYILQYAIVFLGFGLNLKTILQTGITSLPIIVSTISVSLLMAYFLSKVLHIESNVATLVGIGSSVCGGSAIAASAPVLKADDEEVAQAISVIFFFNIIAALIFPALGTLLGFPPDGYAFAVFAGTAVNDTSSVTATAASWDSIYQLGTSTLDTAVTVKLTRTLAIIPITTVLAFWRIHKEAKTNPNIDEKVHPLKVFPMFILYFLLASLITTLFPLPTLFVGAMKLLSKFMITLAMAAIGVNTNIKKLVTTAGKPLLIGFCCWISIISVSLIMEHVLGLL